VSIGKQWDIGAGIITIMSLHILNPLVEFHMPSSPAQDKGRATMSAMPVTHVICLLLLLLLIQQIFVVWNLQELYPSGFYGLAIQSSSHCQVDSLIGS
jgi:hypothetical protein